MSLLVSYLLSNVLLALDVFTGESKNYPYTVNAEL